jgi:hypothetical protein
MIKRIGYSPTQGASSASTSGGSFSIMRSTSTIHSLSADQEEDSHE